MNLGWMSLRNLTFIALGDTGLLPAISPEDFKPNFEVGRECGGNCSCILQAILFSIFGNI